MAETSLGGIAEQENIGRLKLYAMAASAGIAVANIYYNQPMLGIIKADFPGQTAADLIPTATQLGFAAGLFMLVPLGDIRNRRRLIVGQFLALAVILVLAALSVNAVMLLVASVALGAAATVAQQIIPFAASLAAPDRRGAVIGTVMSGLLSGILFSRALSGFVGEYAGWRAMCWLGVPLALSGAALMAATLPNHPVQSTLSYGAALRSLGNLWRSQPSLRRASAIQAMLFGSFTAFWTILALYLQTPAFGLGADVAGLFGVIGAAGIFAAPLAGRMADKRGPRPVILAGAVLTLVSWLVFGVWATVAGLVVGVIVLDFGVQSAMISNQSIIYAIDPAARSRVNTVYMTGMFLGGSLGSALASWAWASAAWTGVCLLGAAMAAVAILLSALPTRPAKA